MVLDKSSYSEVENSAKKFNIEGVNHLRSLFMKQQEEVYNHMRDYHGRIPTVFKRYVPTVRSNIGQNPLNSPQGISSDHDIMTPIDPSKTTTGNLKESSDQTGPIDGDLSFVNYENILFDLLESTKSQLRAAPHVSTLSGVYSSKKFASLFDTEVSARIDKNKKETDYDRIKNVLQKRLASAQAHMLKISSANRMDPDSFKVLSAVVGKSIMKIAQTKRLSTLGMRLKQGYSAMLAQLVNVNRQARLFLAKEITQFTFGSLQGLQNVSKNRNSILSRSVTQSRGGLQGFRATGFLDEIKFDEAQTNVGKLARSISKYTETVADKFLLELTTAQTDRLAGQSTFLAFYMDYMMNNDPSLKEMNDEEFFEYAAKNPDDNAVAYADEQVERSQTQQTPWNMGGIYGTDSGATGKAVADVLFMFGRFVYNRKVGMANDWATMTDNYASDSDKASAGRRLVSASVEIGVFKALGPFLNWAFQSAATPVISGLLGFDEELDKEIQAYREAYGDDGRDIATQKEFKLYNYDRSIAKETITSLFEGMAPTPLPSVVNEAAFAAVNAALKKTGAVESDLINIYNPSARRMFDQIGPLSEEGVAQGIADNLGVFTLVRDDLLNAINSGIYITSDKVKPYRAGGADRYVNPIAKKAGDVLAVTEILGLAFPSGDLNQFNRVLRGKLYRDYLTTIKPLTEEKQLQLQKEFNLPKKVKEKDLEKQEIDRLINDSYK